MVGWARQVDGGAGFIFHRNTRTLTWVWPRFPGRRVRPEATTYVELRDINDLGHATGIQGWTYIPENHAWDVYYEPVFYDGASLHEIGPPASRNAQGIRITNDDKVQLFNWDGSYAMITMPPPK